MRSALHQERSLAQSLAGLLSRLLLGQLLIMSHSIAHGQASDGGYRVKGLVMLRAGGGSRVDRHRRLQLGAQLLQSGLPIQVAAAHSGIFDFFRKQAQDDISRSFESMLAVDSAKDCLGGIGKDGILIAATSGLLALTQQYVRAEVYLTSNIR